MIPFLDIKKHNASLATELQSAMGRVLESGFFILGPETEAFETEFSAYCGAAYCIGVGNGLDALHLILRAYGIGKGDEVIVPSNTYIATWLAVSYAGATPVPVEPCEHSFNIDPKAIEAAITPRTRAIMAVHMYGQTANMQALMAIAERHGIKIIEDAAQAHGATHHGYRSGNLGHAAGFSFYPGKNLGALGDGGAITTSDSALAKRIRMLRNYGSQQKYVHEIQGFNSRLDELQAALLRVKLQHLDHWNTQRQQVAACYLHGINRPNLILPTVDEGNISCWHLFVVRTPQRNKLQAALKAMGINTLIHYPTPPHQQAAYSGQFAADSFPVAERMAQEVLSLPMGPTLSRADMEAVVTEVNTCCAI